MKLKKLRTKRLKKENVSGPKGNRTYQDTLFRFMFSNKESAIELYNALEGTNYDMDTEVEFTTLENVLYVEGKNDLGFSIAGKYVILTEHQSTINHNMPARFLEYIAQTYKLQISNDDLFLRKAISLLTPEFFVIYTGTEDWDVTELRLSDSYVGNPPENSLELVVKIIDLRYNKKKAKAILSRSEKLRGYSLLLEYVREKRKEGYALKSAINMAVERCIDEDILKDFLIRYGREVKGMLYEDISVERFAELRAKEYADEQREVFKAEGRAEGRAEGIAEGRVKGRVEGETSMQNRINKLNTLLIKANRFEDVKKAAKDKNYQQQLFEEFGLVTE